MYPYIAVDYTKDERNFINLWRNKKLILIDLEGNEFLPPPWNDFMPNKYNRSLFMLREKGGRDNLRIICNRIGRKIKGKWEMWCHIKK